MNPADAGARAIQDLVQVRGTDGHFGTGLLVGPGVILTSLHCVADPDDGWTMRGGPLGVDLLRDFVARSTEGKPGSPGAPSRSRAAHVLWHPPLQDPDPPDIVLLRLEPDAHGMLPSPAHAGPIAVAGVGIGSVDAVVVGFPALLQHRDGLGGRREGAFPGRANLLSTSRPVIGFTSTHVAREGGGGDWGGLSGAPLFLGDALLGVVRSAHRRLKADRFLEVEPLAHLLGDERCRELAQYFVASGQAFRPPADSRAAAAAMDDPAAREALDDYLATLRNTMANGQGAYLALAAAEVPRERLVGAAAPRRHGHVRQVRRIIRRVAGVRGGGDLVDAQTAIVDRNSKVIRNIVDELLRTDDPLVLLGDPGTGKSMSMREAALRLAQPRSGGAGQLIPVFIRLGNFCPRGIPTQDDVLASVRNALPPALQARFRELIGTGRLVVLFDGMDEMSRQHYGARIQALSDFAGIHRGRIRTIHSCRINDFTPQFVHRQVVLLPFTRAQVAEYIRKNYGPVPLTVDGRHIGHAELVTVATAEEWRNTLSVPQFLTLFVYFLRDRGQLPRSRGEMLGHFFQSEFDDYAATLEPGRRPEAAAMLQGWAAIACHISLSNTGSGAARQAIEQRFGHARSWPDVIQAGLGCGVLSLVEYDEEVVQFAHHRFQEYFTARYLDGAAVTVDWAGLIDEPRWQETVNYLAAGLENSGAIAAIQASIDLSDGQLRRDDALERAGRERLLADRVEFATRVVRAHQSTGAPALAGLARQCMATIEHLVAYGNPITHVKMVRALANLPRFEQEAGIFRTLLESPVQWVRRQAVILHTHREAGSFGFELAADLAAHTFSPSLPFYWQAIGDAQRWKDKWNLAWATAVGALSALALLAVWFLAAQTVAASVMRLLAFRGIAVPSSALLVGVHGLAACTLVVACGFFHWQRRISLARVAWVGAASLFMAAMALDMVTELGRSSVWHMTPAAPLEMLVGAVFASAILYIAAESVAVVWDIAVLLSYGLGARGLRVADHAFVGLLKSQLRADVVLYIVGGAGLMALGALLAAATREIPGGHLVLGVLAWIGKLLGALLAMGVVGAMIAHRRELGQVARELKWRDWLALGTFLCCVGLVGTAGYVLFGTRLLHDIDIARYSSTVFWSLVALVMTAILAAVGVMLHIGYRLVRQRLAARPFVSLAAWQAALRDAEYDPYAQASLLRGGTVATLRQPALRLWEALVGVEKAIDSEPALSVYWQRRHEIEQILRQQAHESGE